MDTARPMEDPEKSSLDEVLRRTPAAFRRRLERVLRQALEDDADGELELHAEVAGRAQKRGIRQWRAWFRPSERDGRS